MKRSIPAAILGSILALLGLVLSAPLAKAAVAYTVTNGTDTPTTGTLTLRQAISLAVTGDTINFNPSLSTVTLTSGELIINAGINITGPGANLLTIQRAAQFQTFRIFNITDPASGSINPRITGVTVSNGFATLTQTDDAYGGGILHNSRGTLTLVSCAISNNSADDGAGTGFGAGITSFGGTVVITNCTISGNRTGHDDPNNGGYGGGIYNNSGVITTTNSTISGNFATYGGGIYNDFSNLVTHPATITNITNSTVSGNSASGQSHSGRPGGIYNSPSTMSVCTVNARNTIISGNTSDVGGPDYLGTLTSQGYNLIGNTNGATITGTTTGNQLNVDPLLGPLQNNGGPTKTQALSSGSPATDKGSSGGNPNDQRGFSRPVDSPVIPNATGGDGSDIGAFEDQNVCGNQVVTNNNDSGDGSLRAVIASACNGATITFAPSVASPINLTSGELLIQRPVTITGPGANLMTVQRSVSASTNFSIFHVSAGGYATISGLTITKGNPQHSGGGFYVDNGSTLLLENCSVTNNSAQSSGEITQGGGIAAASIGTSVIIVSSTISGNSAPDYGGGIAAGSLTVGTSTISGNTAATYGGGISVSGTTNITNSTIANNSAATGGGLRGNGYSVTVSNSIFAKNTATTTDPDFSGTLSSHGYNLIGNNTGTTITGTTTGNQLNVNPLLGPLQDNGGPTPTLALLTGSPAIDQGQPYGITLADQRGASRPYDFPNIPNAAGGNGSDIGAFEVQPVCGNQIVTNNNDSGPGSLRDAIAATCGGATVTFAPSVVSPINLTSGELGISNPMTISGPGANLMTVQRDPSASTNFSIFAVIANGATNISGLTITKGNPNGSGGGIDMGGGLSGNTLTITDCVIAGNAANSSGVLNSNGGGIFVGTFGAPALIIRRSAISGNSATQDGGGIFTGSSFTLINSTVSGNTAARYGGGLSTGTTTIVNSTIANNMGATGGGVRGGGLGVTARNTIFAKNIATTTDPDFSGTLTSQGFNLIGNNTGTTITPTQITDQIGTSASPIDPLLGPLQNNGGQTLTLALLTGSRAIDKGGSATDPVTGNPVTTDQRGIARPYDDPNIPNATGGNGSDIGAFEVAPTLTPSSVVSRKTHGGAGSFNINLPLTGSLGVECRSGGATNDYQVVFTFASPVTFSSAAVTAGAGTVNGASGSGTNAVTLNLTGVTNAQRMTVTLLSVSNGTSTGDVSVQMGVLVGDTNGSGSINSSDVSQTKLQSGQSVTNSNFREDVNANGTVNSSDVSLVKLRSGTALP